MGDGGLRMTQPQPMSPGRQNALVWAAMSLLLQGLSVPAIKALFSGTAIGPSQGLDVAWIFLATVPLAGAVAIATFVIRYQERSQQTVPWQFLAALAIGSVFAGAWLARLGYFEWFQAHGRLGVDLPAGAPDPASLRGAFPHMAISAVGLYFTFYGPALFFSSCLAGWLFGHNVERVANEPGYKPQVPAAPAMGEEALKLFRDNKEP